MWGERVELWSGGGRHSHFSPSRRFQLPMLWERRNRTGFQTFQSPDTDVTVLAVHFFPQLVNVDKLWIEMGTFPCSPWYLQSSRKCSVSDFPSRPCINKMWQYFFTPRNWEKICHEDWCNQDCGKGYEDLVSLGGSSFEEAIIAAKTTTTTSNRPLLHREKEGVGSGGSK